jgi:hypothetical protein
MRQLLFLLTFFSCALVLAAEETDTFTVQQDRIRIYAGWRFGFGGATQSNTVVGKENVNWAISPTMGAVAWIRFRQNFGLMLEGQYALRGYALRSESGDTSFLTRQRFHFLEFPLLVHASLGNEKFTEFIEVGLAPAFLSGGYREQSAYWNDLSIDASYEKLIFNRPQPFPLKRFDLSFIIGAGLGVKLGPGTLHSGVRLNIGMLDIYKDERFCYDGASQLQRSFNLHFGYVWHVKSFK